MPDNSTAPSIPWPRRIGALLTLLFVVMAQAPAAAPVTPRVADELDSWTPGRKLLERDRFNEARDWFEARQAVAPHDICGHYFSALVYTNFDVDGMPFPEQVVRGLALLDQGLDLADGLDDPTLGTRYCHGALHGLRAAERLKQSKYLGAALDAKRARSLMLELIEDDPSCVDCRFWSGCYDYFADVLPSAVKFFRTLLFFPKGDKRRGLESLQAAADAGEVDRFSALWMLISLYSGPERDPARALTLLEQASRRYPDSFKAALARARYHFDLESPPDRARGLAMHLPLLEASARLDEPHRARIERRVRLSLAQAYLADLRPEEAIETLEAHWPAALEEPESAVEVASALMRAYRSGGEYARAVQTLQAIRERYPTSPAVEALRQVNETIDAPSSRAWAATMVPWRKGRAGQLAEAVAEFERMIAEAPLPEIARFGLAHLYFEIERYDDARPLFESVGNSQLAFPIALRPLAYLRLGNIHDLAGDRRSARSAYKSMEKLSRGQPGMMSFAERYLERAYDGSVRVNFP